MNSSGFNVYPGGKGANQAAAAAKLGYQTFFVGQVGKDAYAPMLKGALSECGVNTTLVSTVNGSWENSIILVGGANKSDEWQITDEATQIAMSARVPVVLDAGGGMDPIGADLLANISILSPNETELSRLTGMPTRTMAQVQAAAESLIHSGVNKVLVKLGSKGCLLVDIYGNVIRQKAFPVLNVVDTTGAGDCFTAAFAVAMLEGKSDAEAMAFASTWQMHWFCI
ncbi:hypothetical protein QBZ16_002363 [Prototheca wickerhamii]|uniref:Carbohydrate kinase PfkB domain-containing protein n=1 Tax=Prototheca wickerhamii TaxID=3111 RepID=A0AAD9MMQ0_PROWI|nr:hypothetical protein QBZ16_002363 [Prototheca wickerhamii]